MRVLFDIDRATLDERRAQRHGDARGFRRIVERQARRLVARNAVGEVDGLAQEGVGEALVERRRASRCGCRAVGDLDAVLVSAAADREPPRRADDLGGASRGRAPSCATRRTWPSCRPRTRTSPRRCRCRRIRAVLRARRPCRSRTRAPPSARRATSARCRCRARSCRRRCRRSAARSARRSRTDRSCRWSASARGTACRSAPVGDPRDARPRSSRRSGARSRSSP